MMAKCYFILLRDTQWLARPARKSQLLTRTSTGIDSSAGNAQGATARAQGQAQILEAEKLQLQCSMAPFRQWR